MRSMKAEMNAAGVKDAGALLDEVVAKAYDAFPRSLPKAQSALADAVYADPILCREAFKSVADTVFGNLLRKHFLKQEKKKARGSSAAAKSMLDKGHAHDNLDGGQPFDDTHSGDAADRDTSTDAGGPPQADTHGLPAASSVRSSAGHDAVARVAMMTIHDTFRTENGLPLGEETKFSLQDLSRRSGQRAWFYDALQHSMPPTGAVKDVWKPEETEMMWRKAQEHNSQPGATP